LCSSFRLLEELTAMAPHLSITLRDGNLPDSEVQRIEADMESESPLWIERTVWLTLFDAARFSIEHKAAICFC
jgi:hypothetical protein